MYLIDSNIFLELLLDQEKADRVELFLRSTPRDKLHISEFSLYSIGIVLIRRKSYDTFIRFIEDIIIRGGVRLLRLSVQEMESLSSAAERFNLDFDDAYQYAIADKYELELISFDSDFDRTDKKRTTPDEAGS